MNSGFYRVGNKIFLNKTIKHYEALEEYATCKELVTLKSRL